MVADAEGDTERRLWLVSRYAARFEANAERFRAVLERFYGKARAAEIKYAEAFEGCEYGSRLTPEEIPRLFPFFG